MVEKSKSTLKESIIERIKQLEEERDHFVIQANQQIAAYNGAIGELQRTINPPPPVPPPPKQKEAKESERS